MNKTLTNFKNRLLAAVALAMLSALPAFAQLNFITGPTANGTSGLDRGPNGSVDFQRTSILYLASNFPGLGAGPVNSVGFSIATPAASAASGNIKIYMANTADGTYSRGTTWATILTTPTAMTLVYDGPMTIPATAGFYNVTLTTPFAYTGGNFYFAYEWNATTKSPGTAVYNANADLAASLRTISGTTLTATDNLTQSSAFRPVLRLGVPAPANDMAVRAVFVQGKVARNGGTPQVIQAVVRNSGSNTLTNKVIRLRIAGFNTFVDSVTLGTLAPGEDSLISFRPFQPTNLGANNTVTVSVGADDILNNNSQTANIVVTAATQGYAQYPNQPSASPAAQTALAGVFPQTGPTPSTRNANFLVRFTSTGRTRVTTVRSWVVGPAFNPNIPSNVGVTVYGVVFNSAGVEVARSSDVVLTAGDLDNFVTFPLTTPVTFEDNEEYYVGMGLPAYAAATTNLFLQGAQSEQNEEVRPNTFFVSPVSTSASVPLDYGDDLRWIIEADIVDVTGLKEELNAKLVSVYPNPSNGVINISAKDLKGGNTLALEVRDMQGRVVYTGTAAKNGAAVNMNKLASGVYMLKVSTDAEVAVKRLVIQ